MNTTRSATICIAFSSNFWLGISYFFKQSLTMQQIVRECCIFNSAKLSTEHHDRKYTKIAIGQTLTMTDLTLDSDSQVVVDRQRIVCLFLGLVTTGLIDRSISRANGTRRWRAHDFVAVGVSRSTGKKGTIQELRRTLCSRHSQLHSHRQHRDVVPIPVRILGRCVVDQVRDSDNEGWSSFGVGVVR